MFNKIKRSLLGLGIALGICSTCYANTADIGSDAPEFTLPTTNGKEIKLADLKDKIVVLEWVNYNCPFVKKHYSSKNMTALQEKYAAKDIVWLSINSGPENPAVGSFNATAMNDAAKANGSKATHILLDRKGEVGKLYKAKTTPHMVVIHKGKVAYIGAIDSIPSANAEDCAKADNYVTLALDAILAGKVVKPAETQGYGCGVKY